MACCCFLTMMYLITDFIIGAEITTVVMGYFQLCSEDYRWWWNSFLVSGASGIYVFFYSVHYFYTQLNITKGTTAVLYFGYMSVISLTYFFATGIIGFSAMFYFNRRIFGAVEVDSFVFEDSYN